MLQVARAEGGVTSNWIHDQLAVGESVKISGAYGTFIGDPSVDTPVLCIAAGTGLAPVLALAEAALRRGFKKPVTMLFSARTKEDVYSLGMMAWWRTKHRNFDYKITLTREEAEGFHKGRVDVVLPQLFKDLSKHTLFVAGSPEFVDSLRRRRQGPGRAGRTDPYRRFLRPAATGGRRRRPPAAALIRPPQIIKETR